MGSQVQVSPRHPGPKALRLNWGGQRLWLFLGRLSRSWREALTPLEKVPLPWYSLLKTQKAGGRGGSTGVPTACPCLSVIPNSHGPFSREETESRDRKCFAQGSWLSESDQRPRPRGPPVHCTEMAVASSLSPPSTPTSLPSGDPDLSLQNYPTPFSGQLQRLGLSQKLRRGEGPQAPQPSASAPPLSDLVMSVVWAAPSTKGGSRGHQCTPTRTPSFSPPPSPVLEREGGLDSGIQMPQAGWKGHSLGWLAPAC